MDGGAPSEGERGPSRGEESRERLVDAAVELVVEHYDQRVGLRDVFAYLTPGAVAQRAGLSRALLYHHWGDTEHDGTGAFEAFLAEVADRLWSRPVTGQDLPGQAVSLPRNMSDVVMAVADGQLARARADAASWRAGEALALHGVVPAQQGVRAVEELAQEIVVLLAWIERGPVPPLTAIDLAAACSAVFEGFVLSDLAVPGLNTDRVEWTPSQPPEATDGGWTLLAITLESMLLHMTRPLTPPGAGTPPGPG
jgi:AcrR family transcriptional regulator